MIIYKILIFIVIIMFLSCGGSPEKQPEPIPYSEIKNLYKDELMEWNKEITQTDKLIIEKFIERRKWDMNMSGTGLFYQIYHHGNGKKAENGKYAEFKYTTSLLDGTVLYTSEEYGNRTLLIGRFDREIGLHEGLQLMRVGDKARFVLHPFLAFGLPGDGYKVPLQAILLYDIELIDVRDNE